MERRKRNLLLKNKPVVQVTVREEKVELRSYFDPLKDSDADSFAKYEEDGKKEICFAYKFDKCPNKDGNGCPNRHPQKCEKFCEFGHKSIDPKGCETSECTLLHPKLCRNSTNRKECPFRKCRFQHLKGTRFVPRRDFESARSVVEKNESEGKNKDFITEKLDKLIELITVSIRLSQEKKS